MLLSLGSNDHVEFDEDKHKANKDYLGMEPIDIYLLAVEFKKQHEIKTIKNGVLKKVESLFSVVSPETVAFLFFTVVNFAHVLLKRSHFPAGYTDQHTTQVMQIAKNIHLDFVTDNNSHVNSEIQSQLY
mmetsp:Transcript_24016/g.36934  ORF Transcript_24016/g.36934 Transcript_24016/m.36934 type:complete len:129 (-) Transcript_24016:1596-1982(-)